MDVRNLDDVRNLVVTRVHMGHFAAHCSHMADVAFTTDTLYVSHMAHMAHMQHMVRSSYHPVVHAFDSLYSHTAHAACMPHMPQTAHTANVLADVRALVVFFVRFG